MFKNLTNKLINTLKNIKNRGRLTKKNIQKTLRDIRISLLEADVSLNVIKKIIKDVEKKSLGIKINQSFTPGQELINILKNELIKIMGNKNKKLRILKKNITSIMLIGSHGSGKTTSLGKLAYFLKKKNKKILLASTDIYRPAANKQLKTLSLQANVDIFEYNKNITPLNIAINALSYAKKKFYDILLLDTAGRTHTDIYMMKEVKEIHNIISPKETLFVIDAMTGQDAFNISKKFNDVLPITGIILTKLDGDSRGGVALSVKYITGKPIKFIGIGEKIHDLEEFHPDRIVSRILGMGDMLSIIEEIKEKVDIIKKNKKGNKKNNFDLNDFLVQIKNVQKTNKIKNLFNKLPQNMQTNKSNSFDNSVLKKAEAIINSMTKEEKINTKIIKRSRKKRIADGSGTKIQEVNRVIKQYDIIKKMLKKINKNGINSFISKIKNFTPNNFFK
ncbi:signal recognition particle protein [Buchnera aphidicola (Taiwanaphis decaspermi)]|uniref:signal recognition particle protein n=1 Tax=Buchnera aphidicola TaxID=9 RepID=UPI0031B85861